MVSSGDESDDLLHHKEDREENPFRLERSNKKRDLDDFVEDVFQRDIVVPEKRQRLAALLMGARNAVTVSAWGGKNIQDEGE